MISTSSSLWLELSFGLLAAGLVLGALLGLARLDRWLLTHRPWHPLQRVRAILHRVEAPVYPRHRALAPVEVIRPIDNATLDQWTAASEQERTEEIPVVHVEVDEEPAEAGAIGTVAAEVSEDLADVLTSREQAIAAVWDRAHDDHELWLLAADVDDALARFRLAGQDRIDQWLREAGELPGRAEARRAAHPDCDDPSIEMNAAELATLIDEARVGASR